MAWKMIAALPGVNLPEAVTGVDMALIGTADPRYQEILQQAGVAEYLGKFSTPFGTRLKPTLITVPDSVERADATRVTELRNIAALSWVLRARVDTHIHSAFTGVGYADLFDIYPVALASDPTYVYLLAPSEQGLVDFERFKSAQPFPVLVFPEHYPPREPDRSLMAALLAAWNSTSRRRADREFRNRIFASVTLAYYALRAPFANLRSRADRAIPLAMWVPAFEALAAPPTGNVGSDHVEALVKAVPWHSERLRARRFRPIDTHGSLRRAKPSWSDVTLPIQICRRLYRNRNRILHGYPFEERGASEPGWRRRWGSLYLQAPSLYRNVLLHLLSSNGFGVFPPRLPWPGTTETMRHDDYEAVLREGEIHQD